MGDLPIVHKGQLVLAVLVGAVSTLIALLDPFQTDGFWHNWIGLALASIAGVLAPMCAAALLNFAAWPADRYGFTGQIMGGLAAVMIGFLIVLAGAPGAESGYVQLIWAGFALAMVSYLISATIGYLAER